MSPQDIIKEKSFIQDQLEQTTKNLFNARSVREIHFLQQKLDYFKERMNASKKSSKAKKAPSKTAKKAPKKTRK